MRRAFPLLALALAFAGAASASYCNGSPDPNAKPNMKPIYTGAPVFVSAVPNGQLWSVGEGDNQVPVVHLWGTPYQKGFAHGTLLKTRVTTFIDSVWTYLEDQVEAAINGSLSKPIFSNQTLELIANIGLEAALDLTSDLTSPYTGAYFFQQLQGLSDASGESYDRLRRIHMLGELTKGSCSMFGAWGEALADASGLITMRALDWDVDGPFKDFPELTVYHAAPNSTENTFLNIGWTGWIGSISGVNNQQMSIHEIGVSFPDSTFGAESSEGVPFTYVLRDILQFDQTRLDGVSRLASAKRTCDLILGVGGGKDKRFNSVQYSASVCNIMDDTNLKPVGSWHAPLTNVVYHGMDWLCKSYNTVMHAQLQKIHGSLTPELAIQQVMPIVQTGDLHVYVADLVNMVLYYSRAASTGDSGPAMAYDRPFLRIDLNALWAVAPAPPSMGSAEEGTGDEADHE